MRIDGGGIAQAIREDLETQIAELAKKKIVPKIAIITLGPEASWETYVRQKIKVASELGIKAILINLENANDENLIQTVRQIDSDFNYHGIIIQRPIPSNFNREQVVNSISPEKDIDGFRIDSDFEVPAWLAVKHLVTESLKELNIKKSWKKLNFAVIGKGETAGEPIIRGLKKLGVEPEIIDSKTLNRDEILQNADVVISTVGRKIVKPNQLKKGTILIGVGIHSEGGKARGDYDENEIEPVAAAYTPTPGGVGPLNLAYLYKNLIQAAKTQDMVDK